MDSKSQENDLDLDWTENYPCYAYKSTDSLLKEWDLSSEALKIDERLINVLFVFGTIFTSSVNAVLFSQNEKIFNLVSSNAIVLLLVNLLFQVLIAIYISESMKSIVWAKRKLIVIRHMLGINWGNQKLVLPTYRFEGAAHPFVIKMFPGYLSAQAMPFVVISILNIFVVLYLSNLTVFQQVGDVIYTEILGLGLAIIVGLYSVFVFRINLLDENENLSLSITKVLAKAMHFKLITNMEYTMYKAKLCVNECKRLGIDFRFGEKCAISIEDKRFMTHRGIDYKSIGRALAIRLPLVGNWISSKYNINRSSGGSTITQQLIRTLFFQEYSKTLRRKFFEIIMARFWLENILTKSEILQLYLASVTYARSKPGLIKGLRHYGFNSNVINESIWFYMVERIAYSVKGQYNMRRIHLLLDSMYLKDDNTRLEILNIFENKNQKSDLPKN